MTKPVLLLCFLLVVLLWPALLLFSLFCYGPRREDAEYIKA